MKLFQIAREYELLLDELYDEEGNVNKDALMKLEQSEIAVEKKAIAVASYIKNMEAERAAIDEAKKAMADRERRHKKRIEDLEGYLLSNMQRCGIDKISCPYFEIKMKKCPPSVDIQDENALPSEYIRTKVEHMPDKVKMKEEMMAGVIIPGASLKQNLRLDIR